MTELSQRASIIGSGPNGLAAAITLAQAGYAVDVYEAEAQPGGAARTMPLTLPGFLHDFGSAVHPLAAGSPFFRTLPLERHGLRWLSTGAAVAHPFDDGTAVILHRDFAITSRYVGQDRTRWRDLFHPLAENWDALAEDLLAPILRWPRHPLMMARFGKNALQPASFFARNRFENPRTRALFAGLAAHSGLSLSAPLSAAVGIVLAAAAHAAGWPIPAGGAQSITDALAAHLASLGGTLHTPRRVESLTELPIALTLCDVSPQSLLKIAGDRLTPAYRESLTRYQPGAGAFKIDYALSSPIPWLAPDCASAVTVHLGGTEEEIAFSEQEVAAGRTAERPFVLLAQPTLLDSTRAPEGRHTAWAYCHVPNGSTEDMAEHIERQIQRFAPRFRECVLARRVSGPANLEASDANLTGGDINGGAMTFLQCLFRPTCSLYATPDPKLYLCSASTPPGGGVHGMCGFHAAQLALRHQK